MSLPLASRLRNLCSKGTHSIFSYLCSRYDSEVNLNNLDLSTLMTTTKTTTTTTTNTAKFTLQCSQPETNGAKLSRLIVDGGTEAIRRVLERHYPTPELLAQGLRSYHTTLLDLLRRRILNDTQWYLLFPKGGDLPNLRNFDITLLFVLIRNVCGLSPPSTGWNAEPLATDNSQEANIVRMKWYRNEIYAHASSTSVDTAVFESCWKNVSEALVALGIDREEIERLKLTSLDAERYLQLLGDWVAQEEMVQRELVTISTVQENNSKILCSVQQGQQEIMDAVQDKGVVGILRSFSFPLCQNCYVCYEDLPLIISAT